MTTKRNNKRNKYITTANDGVSDEEIKPFAINTHDNSAMIKRLSKCGARVCHNAGDILYLIDMEHEDTPEVRKRMNNYFNDYPYYVLYDICKIFDIKRDICTMAFELEEMPIVNKTMFLSVAGIYKAILFSEMPLTTKLLFSDEYIKKTGMLEDKEWYHCTLDGPEVTPKVLINYCPLYEYGLNEVLDPNALGTIFYLMRLRHNESVMNFVYTTMQTTNSSVLLTKGMISSGNAYSHFYANSGLSGGIMVMKNRKKVKLSKKFRPILRIQEIKRHNIISFMAALFPEYFASAFLQDRNIHVLYKLHDFTPGMLYEKVDKTMYVGDYSEDIIADHNTLNACPIIDKTMVAKMIGYNWSFSELTLLYGDTSTKK